MSATHSRRWFSPQPNVPGRGIVAGYSARFWLIVGLIGILTGAAAAALMGLLTLTEHLAFGYHHGGFLAGIEAASPARRVLVLVFAAVIVAGGTAIVRTLPVSGGTEVAEAVWLHAGRLPLLASLARGALSIISVGMGVSLGREAAPQLAGAAVGSRLAEWGGLPVWQRRLLVASGAGAGFAAVYNVPLGGALFALEVMLGTLALPLVLPALATAVIATAVAWTTLGTAHTYFMPAYGVHAAQIVWALVFGPLIGVAAVGWVKLIAVAVRVRLRRHHRLVGLLLAFTAIGVLAIPYPQLLGNGKAIVQLTLIGGVSLGLSAVLLALKPLTTASSLGAGALGGLFTPTLAVGVLLATVLAQFWSHLWPHTVPASYAVIGGGAFLAAAMQGPLSGTVLVLELTPHFDAVMAPTLLAVTLATVASRRLGAPSIYSARIPGLGIDGLTPAAALAARDAIAVMEREESGGDWAPPPDADRAGR